MNLKKIVRRLRASNRKDIPLCHILINIRSNHHGSLRELNSFDLAEILSGAGFHREFGAKCRLLGKYGGRCLNPLIRRPQYGHKTIFFENKWIDEKTLDKLPF